MHPTHPRTRASRLIFGPGLALGLLAGLALAATALAAESLPKEGKQMVGQVMADQKVDGKALYTAKCASCHGADGTKSLMSKPVKGLSAEKFTKMMQGYKAKTYGGAKKATMENVASGLTDADIQALAAHVSSL